MRIIKVQKLVLKIVLGRMNGEETNYRRVLRVKSFKKLSYDEESGSGTYADSEAADDEEEEYDPDPYKRCRMVRKKKSMKATELSDEHVYDILVKVVVTNY